MTKSQLARLREIIGQRCESRSLKDLAGRIGVSPASLTKFLKGQRPRKEGEYLQKIASVLGMPVRELGELVRAYYEVSAVEEEADQRAIEDALRVLVEPGVQNAVADILWEGIYGIVSDMIAPSLSMMEFLVCRLFPILSSGRLRGTLRMDLAFQKLLLRKMESVWKFSLLGDESRKRVFELNKTIMSGAEEYENRHRISISEKKISR